MTGKVASFSSVCRCRSPLAARLRLGTQQSLHEITEGDFTAGGVLGDCCPVAADAIELELGAQRCDTIVLQVHAATCNNAS
jgi:hypothetical protein